MHDDLTYRQQRNLNLISESVLTGRSEPAFQAGREAAMLNEGKNKRLFFDPLGVFDRGTKLGDLIRAPRRATTKVIRAVDDALGDNLDNETERKTAEVLNLLIAAGLVPSPPGVPNIVEPPEDKSDDGDSDDDFDFGA